MAQPADQSMHPFLYCFAVLIGAKHDMKVIATTTRKAWHPAALGVHANSLTILPTKDWSKQQGCIVQPGQVVASFQQLLETGWQFAGDVPQQASQGDAVHNALALAYQQRLACSVASADLRV
jgi:hypothetical protein